MGRPLKGRESQKTCLNIRHNLRGREVPCLDLEDKKGKSPDRFISVRVFFGQETSTKPKQSIFHEGGKKAKVEAPHDAMITMTIKADANGVFTFGIPRAGWWGFAALGAGGDLKHNGKELSQDAVIWVQALDMK